MSKQLVPITLFICTILVTINAFGKVDASYSWTDSDLDNIIPDENDDVFQKPHSYFAYSIHDNEDSKCMNKENTNIVEEVVVPLKHLAELSPNKDNGNETEKFEDVSQKEFMNDMHQLINTLVEESDTEDIPFKEKEEEQQQQQQNEQEVDVAVPLLDEELTFNPMEEIELFSLIIPESQKDVTEKLQKEIPSAESNPVLVSTFPKESSNKDLFIPSKNDDLARNQKSIIPSLKTNQNGDAGEIVLEMDLFPIPEHRPTYQSGLSQKKSLLPFLFSSRIPDTTLAHSWHSLINPTTTYMHHSVPSTKFYFNSNGELKDINPRKILNSLKATSVGEMKYQPLREHLFSSSIGFNELTPHIYGHSPYHKGDISYDLDFLHHGISINDLRESKYTHKNSYAILPSVDAATQLKVMMNPAKRLLHKMMVIEPPAVLHIEPILCHRAYKHPQTHIVF